jgi:uncharacterized protein (DUF433 family)
MAAPQALTPEQIQQIIAAGRGNTVNIGGTLYGANYADTGSGETFQEGALSGITGSTGINQAGQPFYSYDPSGAFTGQGVTKKSQSFFGGLADAFKDPVVLAALGAAGYGGLLGGAASTAGAGVADLAAADIAGGLIPEFGTNAAYNSFMTSAMTPAAIASMEALVAANPEIIGSGITATDAAAKLASSGLTAAQVAQLAKAGISLAGIIGAGNAVSNMGGGGTTTAAGVSIPTQGTPQYNADYYARVQGAYNQALPGMPRDVVSNLAAWYGGDSGMMSGTDTANTAIAKQVTKSDGITRTPAKLVGPMTDLMNAYRSGNVADTKQALIGALNAGMTTEQLMSTFNLGMKDIDYLRGQGYYLPAMTNEIKDVVGQELKNPATAYANIVAKMDATGTNPAAVAAALGLSTEEVQNAYNQLNPTGLFASNNPNFGAVDAGLLYNVAANPTDYQTAIQEIQKYRAADEVGQQSVVEKALAAELAARPGSSLSALQQAGSTYGVSAADIAAAYAKLGYA